MEKKMTRKERREKAKEIAAKYREKHRLRELESEEAAESVSEDAVPAAEEVSVEEVAEEIRSQIGDGTEPIDVAAILRELDEEHRAEVEAAARMDAERMAAAEAAARARNERLAAIQAAERAEAERRALADAARAEAERYAAEAERRAAEAAKLTAEAEELAEEVRMLTAEAEEADAIAAAEELAEPEAAPAEDGAEPANSEPAITKETVPGGIPEESSDQAASDQAAPAEGAPAEDTPAAGTESEKEAPKKKSKAWLFILAILAVCAVCAYAAREQLTSALSSTGESAQPTSIETEAPTEAPETEPATEASSIPAEMEEALAQADLLAAGYDYDAALELLNGLDTTGFSVEGENPVQAKIAEIEAIKADLVKVDYKEVTHIFYHSLVVEPEKTYQQTDSLVDSYKLWMTTVDEFNQITQTMYDRGYVLISIYDLFEETVDEDGDVHYKEKDLYLPKGKKAFILSLDDLSYYHCYEGRHMASKMIIGEDGKPTCEYVKDDGTTVVGDYDCVPLLDKFLEEHPDGCYRGARGTIALTGYNGILGYRTDIAYKTYEHLDDDQAQWLDAHPDFDWDQEREEAKKVVECLKEDGWTFASHTWGHRNVGNISVEGLEIDSDKWEAYVRPLVGDTDIIIFAHGTDLSSEGADGYVDSEKYYLLKDYGFHIFCDVDSNQYRFDIRDTFVHSGRRNLDGYRIYTDAYTDADRTSDLFDASEIVDPARHDMPEPS